MLLGASNPAGTSGSVLNYIGEHAYLYTGGVDNNGNSETTLAEFSTAGNSYIVGAWQPGYIDNSTQDFEFRLYFNNQVVASIVLTSARDYSPYEEIDIVIPTDTNVKITCKNLSSSDTVQTSAIITGRVYQ